MIAGDHGSGLRVDVHALSCARAQVFPVLGSKTLGSEAVFGAALIVWSRAPILACNGCKGDPWQRT